MVPGAEKGERESGAGSMRVIEITRPGGPEVLRLAERPLPEPGRGELRVRVTVSGVNRADLLQRRGRYPAPPGVPPDVPGLEFSGEVDRVGEGCRLRSVGERVMGILGGGGYSESVLLPEREAIRVPEKLSLEEAGAIPEVFLTAWDALFLQAGLQAGETVLIHAVGSGVGTAALQLARAAGAITVGTSRTRAKVDRALSMGLDHGLTIDEGASWAEPVHDLLSGRGVDVILDLVGAAYLEDNQAVLSERARWVVVGVPGGGKGTLDLRRMMVKRASLRGTVLRARPPEEKATLAREFERVVIPLFASARLHPVVDRILPATKAAEAHRRMEANRSFGKLLLSWRESESHES